ncbi:MAG: hypothetical protein ABF868_06870 [Sporolactobacillus sp.]
MTDIIGKTGALLTGSAIFIFAVSMIIGLFTDTLFASCFASLFIAIGYLLFVSALAALSVPEKRAAAGAAFAFALVYAVLVALVYYAQLTTVHLHPSLSGDVLDIISYGRSGSLFFNYDLLGYAFMGLSTFFAAFALEPRDRGDKVLRTLLAIHGLFFFSCLIVPLFPVFTPGASIIPGTILLECWCAYFLPIMALGLRYFHMHQNGQINDTPPVR